MKRTLVWVIWLLGSVAMATWMGITMTTDVTDAGGVVDESALLSRAAFLPGTTTAGHYQIELACNVCHTPMQGVRQDACTQCHGAELERAADSHPPKKFLAIDKAELVERLDARWCVTCHEEHVPDRTRPMGVTMPMDYCYHCHKDIGETRPNHARFAFDSCATAGCHNFHDNRGLNEPFLRAHLDDKDHLDKQVIAKRMPRKTAAWDAAAVSALVANDADTPSGVEADANLHSDWAASTHARAGVNCTSCHHAKDEATGTTAWIDRPDHTSCNGCHTHEVEGFLAGRHGMRLAAGFSAMTPAKARLPMKRDAAHRELSCVSCHSDHRFDTTFAAADACVSCHDDGHTLAYKDSPHAALWRAEVAGDAEAGTGVSCATCHLPREVHRSSGVEIARVQHNQNDNLRPNEKMLRNVCVSCHGAQFALNALADRALIDRNFTGDAATHVTSLELIRTKLAEIERKRKERRSRQ